MLYIGLLKIILYMFIRKATNLARVNKPKDTFTNRVYVYIM
jgi:hypothetical protein